MKFEQNWTCGVHYRENVGWWICLDEILYVLPFFFLGKKHPGAMYDFMIR